MKMLSFGHVRIALLFFVIFFGISAAAQFLFVRTQSDLILEKEASNGASSLNEAIDYDNGFNIANYNKANIQATNYYVVFSDGSLFDYYPNLKVGVPSGLIPPVECPVLTDNVFKAPFVVSYLGPAKKPEKWTLYGKRLDKGYVVVGVSEYDDFSGVEDSLRTNLGYFGSTFESAKKVNTSKIDSFISYALVDEKGMLTNGGGRIPLKTNGMQIGANAASSGHKQFGTVAYYVWYTPIIDKRGNPVGTTIITKEINSSETMVRNMLSFSILVALISIIVFLIVTSIYNSRNEKAKREIRESFQKYFSPQILQAILKEPDKLKLGGQRREITVLFSDIRSFTALAERLAPAALSLFLQEYFNEMTEAVFATDGIVDKYIGDAVMAFWGAPMDQPDQADRAVRTAIDMMSRLKRLQGKWAKEGYSQVDIGIGINLGIAAIGNFGSTKRFDYTVIGDTVNAAARLESLNKEFHSNILISESVKAQLSIQVEMLDKGEVQIRGKEKSVRVFQVAPA
jgi:class 3 adenylate cyclase